MDVVPLMSSDIQRRIFTLRNQQVMLDRDLAQLYGVKTMALNQAVKRNIGRFPLDFRFQLNQDELSEVITICDNPQEFKYLPVKPHAFTEQGVAMLSAVLKSERAVQVSVQIMQTFVQMRHILQASGDIFKEIEQLKIHQVRADSRIDELFFLMDQHKVDNTQGIFFQGQVFDAYAKFESFIRQAKKSLVLIDNYVDLPVLERLAVKRRSVQATI